MLVQTTSFTMVRRLSIYVSPFHSIHMNRIHYANYFGLTIWWRQQDGSGANRSFGVFRHTNFFDGLRNRRSRRSHAASVQTRSRGEGRGERDSCLPPPSLLPSTCHIPAAAT